MRRLAIGIAALQIGLDPPEQREGRSATMPCSSSGCAAWSPGAWRGRPLRYWCATLSGIEDGHGQRLWDRDGPAAIPELHLRPVLERLDTPPGALRRTYTSPPPPSDRKPKPLSALYPLDLAGRHCSPPVSAERTCARNHWTLLKSARSITDRLHDIEQGASSPISLAGHHIPVTLILGAARPTCSRCSTVEPHAQRQHRGAFPSNSARPEVARADRRRRRLRWVAAIVALFLSPVIDGGATAPGTFVYLLTMCAPRALVDRADFASVPARGVRVRTGAMTQNLTWTQNHGQNHGTTINGTPTIPDHLGARPDLAVLGDGRSVASRPASSPPAAASTTNWSGWLRARSTTVSPDRRWSL